MYINNHYHQQITFITDVINISLYKIIYIDLLFKDSYDIIYSNSKYYIVSNTIINTNFNYIYTIDLNNHFNYFSI